jgi:probable HAF family extracellular repeat protein
VGESLTAEGQAHAFLWANGAMTDLGTLGGSYSVARSINPSGMVVGYSETAEGDQRAFLWVDGVMTDLGTLTGSSNSVAWGINARGEIVGESGQHATLWTRK